MDPTHQAVLPDAAAALIEVINLDQPTSRSLYRKLKLALAPFHAEIKSPGVVQALLHRKPFQVALQRIASSLNELLSAEYVQAQYLQLLENDASRHSSGFSLLRGVWGAGDEGPSPAETFQNLLHRPHPILHIFHHLIQRCDTRNLDLKQLIGGETSQLKEAITRVKRWNSMVDEMYDDSDSESSETEAPEPPSLELIFSKKHSVPYSSRALYEILHQNWPCGADVHNHNGRLGLCFEAKFCLDPRWASGNHINDDFLMLLNGPDIRQECRICTSTSGTFKNTAPACLIDHDDQSRSVCLYLTMDEDNKLWNDHQSAQPLEVMMEGEVYVEMSLSELLTTVKPTYTAKRVMGVTLARCILHLFEGPWLQGCMSINDIFVYCRIENNQPHPIFDKVFVATRFGKSGNEGGTTPGTYKIHPFPTILALGIILIELELGEDLSDIKKHSIFTSKKGQPFYLARYLLKEFQKHFTMDSGLIRAVKFCIDRASFSLFDTLDSSALLLNQEFINVYYENIVRPLEQDLVRGAHWTWDQVDELRPPSTDTGVCKIITSKTFSPMHDMLIDRASVHLADSPSNSAKLNFNKRSISSSDVIEEKWSHSVTIEEAERRHSYDSLGHSSVSYVEDRREMNGQPGLVLEYHPTRPQSRDDFQIAIICALPTEANAVQSIFDRHWDTEGIYQYGKQAKDPNSYSTGLIGNHNVVLAHQPRMGKATAANVAAACSMSFPNINLALIIGVCGGVPFPGTKKEILLGDVVISKGIVQYDFGRRYPDGFRPKVTIDDQPGRPNREISSLMARLELNMQRVSLQQDLAKYLDELDCATSNPSGDFYPGHLRDRLFDAEYVHKHQLGSCNMCKTSVCNLAMQSTCQDLKCGEHRLIGRLRQNERNRPSLHFGLMGSGDTVLKSAVERDRIAKEANVIAFEMEGSGVWETMPCVIIKGVCDYADSHKNKEWHDYAATTAAASTKAFLRHWSVGIQSRNSI